MFYSLGLFVLDTKKETLYLKDSKEIVSNNTRVVSLLVCLVEAFPEAVSKIELTEKLWPDSDVTGWSLSRLASTLRQQLSVYDSENDYIKTIHTKGFKLAVKPVLVEDFNPNVISSNKLEIQAPLNKVLQKKSNGDAGKNKKTISKKWILASLFCSAIAVIFYIFHSSVESTNIYGEIDPEKNIELSVTSGWAVTSPGTIQYSTDGVVIESLKNEPIYASTKFTGPAFFQGTTFSLALEANKEFVDDKGWLQAYFLTQLEGWPGEWDCGIEDKLIQQLNFEYHCRIDESGSYTKVIGSEVVNFGIKILKLQQGGQVKIKAAMLRMPASISTDRGWKTTEKIPFHYDRGVSYQPHSLAHQLSTSIKGPLNIRGSKIAFTFEADDAAKKSIPVLQFFVIDKNEKWQDCFVNLTDLETNLITYVCEFNYSKELFVLGSREQVRVGVRPNGKNIKGEVKIIGATISE